MLATCPHATYWKWLLAGWLHFAVGAVMILDVFALLMQQTDVISLGLKYAAFGFFSKIDNVAFTIAKKGICSVSKFNQHATPAMLRLMAWWSIGLTHCSFLVPFHSSLQYIVGSITS